MAADKAELLARLGRRCASHGSPSPAATAPAPPSVAAARAVVAPLFVPPAAPSAAPPPSTGAAVAAGGAGGAIVTSSAASALENVMLGATTLDIPPELLLAIAKKNGITIDTSTNIIRTSMSIEVRGATGEFMKVSTVSTTELANARRSYAAATAMPHPTDLTTITNTHALLLGLQNGVDNPTLIVQTPTSLTVIDDATQNFMRVERPSAETVAKATAIADARGLGDAPRAIHTSFPRMLGSM